MFIELTDHLRCPEDHAEQFVVLLPDRLEERQVIRGSLGCPVCGAIFAVEDSVARFAPVERGAGETALSAGAALALTGIGGPGGYLVLAGAAGSLAPELGPLLPQTHLVLVNPPEGIRAGPMASVLEARALPLKTASMRSVVVGRDLGADPRWVREAVRVVLPGNRIVIEGEPMEDVGAEVLASAPGAWVGRRTG
jgi:hypothetical protein